MRERQERFINLWHRQQRSLAFSCCLAPLAPRRSRHRASREGTSGAGWRAASPRVREGRVSGRGHERWTRWTSSPGILSKIPSPATRSNRSASAVLATHRSAWWTFWPIASPSAARLSAEYRAPSDERLAGLDHVEIGDCARGVAGVAHPSLPAAREAQLGHGDKRDDPGAPADDAPGGVRVRRGTRIEQPADDVSVDDDVREPSSLDHVSASAP